MGWRRIFKISLQEFWFPIEKLAVWPLIIKYFKRNYDPFPYYLVYLYCVVRKKEYPRDTPQPTLQQTSSNGRSEIASLGPEHKRNSQAVGNLKLLGRILNQRDPEESWQTQQQAESIKFLGILRQTPWILAMIFSPLNFSPKRGRPIRIRSPVENYEISPYVT